MISFIYKRSLNILKSMPLRLWGLSLLSGLLTILILIFGVLPIITIPVIAVLTAGMAMVYLDGYKGKEVYSDQLFAGFKNFTHVAGGMCWQLLWVLIWMLIPIAGIVLAVIKSLEYAFTPYILLDEPSVSATEALRKSMQDTKGYKWKMFLATMLPVIGYAALTFILGLLARIPFVGILFGLVSFIVSLVFGLLAPLFIGLVKAGFYEYAKKPVPSSQTSSAQSEPSGPVVVCQNCGTENSGTGFCKRCGSKL